MINYIEVLEDDKYEYIVYEYNGNLVKKIKFNKLVRKIFFVLYEQFYINAIKDKNINVYYIIDDSNILVKK